MLQTLREWWKAIKLAWSGPPPPEINYEEYLIQCGACALYCGPDGKRVTRDHALHWLVASDGEIYAVDHRWSISGDLMICPQCKSDLQSWTKNRARYFEGAKV